MGESVLYGKKALVFDTETTGMIHKKLPPDHPSQPDLIQLAVLLVDLSDWKIHTRISTLVQLREEAIMDPKAEQVHGISKEQCNRYGIDPRVACALFNQLCMQADIIVAHNFDFDQKVILTALSRIGGKPHRFEGALRVCTKDLTTDILCLPGKFGYKWPTLAEAYRHYTGEEIQNAHDALGDAEACLEVFKHLYKDGAIPNLE